MGQARFHKLDFPKYDGTGDPMPFVNKCEHYFRGQRTIEEEKVWLAALNLDDTAQQWYTQVEKDEGTPSWNRFKELLDLCFGPPYAPIRWASSLHAASHPRWSTSRIASKSYS